MLFRDVPRRHHQAIAISDGRAKYALSFKDALAMMTEGPVTEITECLLGGVYYLDNHDFTHVGVNSTT